MGAMSRFLARLAPLLVAPWFGACAADDGAVRVQDLPATEFVTAESYVIGVGDLLDVRVYNDVNASAQVRVRADGKVTITLLGDVEARGKSPGVLAHEIEDRLQKYINSPHVTIGIVESKPLAVSVLGEIAHPGMFTLQPGDGVLQALASAGGFTEFADHGRIYVVRRSPPLKVRFSYDALTANQGNAARFVLRSGDVVTVE